MAKGNWSGGAADATIIEANKHREYLTIQMGTAGTCALAFGEAAIAGEGIQLLEIGDTVKARGLNARLAVHQIGAGVAGTWQDGDLEFSQGPNPSP
ncbi:unnamed protein product [marine sediment metagenome]|uniref:Uncharacterized protein n=1 Tax=marine sediment metagenome TaxID=412755 RepID=X0SNT0_9ZZZZ